MKHFTIERMKIINMENKSNTPRHTTGSIIGSALWVACVLFTIWVCPYWIVIPDKLQPYLDFAFWFILILGITQFVTIIVVVIVVMAVAGLLAALCSKK